MLVVIGFETSHKASERKISVYYGSATTHTIFCFVDCRSTCVCNDYGTPVYAYESVEFQVR